MKDTPRPSVVDGQLRASSGKTPAEFRFQVPPGVVARVIASGARITSVLKERKPAPVRLYRPGSIACLSLLAVANPAKRGGCREPRLLPGRNRH